MDLRSAELTFLASARCCVEGLNRVIDEILHRFLACKFNADSLTRLVRGDTVRYEVGSPEYFVFTLYVKDRSADSRAVYERLASLCFEHLAGKHVIKLVDAVKDSTEFEKANILATPTIVQNLPKPIKIFLGDLTNDGPFRLAIQRAE